MQDTSLLIENGKIFVEGRETVNPTEIGYALLDVAENNGSIVLKNNIPEPFNLFKNKEIVYLVHDVEQYPRMILSTIIEEDAVKYELISGTEVSIHYGFELIREKIVM